MTLDPQLTSTLKVNFKHEIKYIYSNVFYIKRTLDYLGMFKLTHATCTVAVGTTSILSTSFVFAFCTTNEEMPIRFHHKYCMASDLYFITEYCNYVYFVYLPGITSTILTIATASVIGEIYNFKHGY